MRNKLFALAIIVIGVLSMILGNDATVFVLCLVMGTPMFFSKENWICNFKD